MKKINIDFRQSNGYGGIANYIRNISSRLVSDDEYKFSGCTFLYRNRSRHDFDWFPGTTKFSVVPERIAYECPFLRRNSGQVCLPVSYEFLTDSKADLNVFFSYQLPQLKFEAPVVSTIHDIILLKTKTEPQSFIDEHLRILLNTVNRSDYFLTVSEASKRDLVDYFSIDPDKIYIVHNGIPSSQASGDKVGTTLLRTSDHEPFFRHVTYERKEYIKHKYNLPDRFILNFGAYRKHKNIERLIEAYASLRLSSGQSLDKDIRSEIKLVLTRSHPDLDKLIARYGIQSDVKVIGFVQEGDKADIFRLADMVYYASLYEGFGVPVIEAQAAGTPVITSTTSSLPEAAGENGAAFVNPYSVEEIRDAITRITSDDDYRKSLIINGLNNSRQYTWERSVREFYGFLTSIDL